MTGSEEVLSAFEQECGALATTLRGLSEDDLGRPTNCPPWDLKDLVVHILGSACRPPTFLAGDGGAGVVDAAGYYRRDERGTEAYRNQNVARTQRAARRFGSGAEAVAELVRSWPLAAAAYRDASGTFVETQGLVLTTEDFLRTRLLAVAAHAVDAAITLDRAPWTTPAAAAQARAVLVALLGTEPPDELGWSDVDLLVIGTGRCALSDTEAQLLGDSAGRFPLLS